MQWTAPPTGRASALESVADEATNATFNSGDTSALSGFCAADARVVPAGGEPVAGPAAIGSFFADLIAKGFSGHRITVAHVDEKGPVAIAIGKWRLSGPGEGAATTQFGGNWVNVLERGPDGWRVLLHTWN